MTANWRISRLLSTAAVVWLAGATFAPAAAEGLRKDPPLAEVQINGSAYDQLNPAMLRHRHLAPITLVPPSDNPGTDNAANSSGDGGAEEDATAEARPAGISRQPSATSAPVALMPDMAAELQEIQQAAPPVKTSAAPTQADAQSPSLATSVVPVLAPGAVSKPVFARTPDILPASIIKKPVVTQATVPVQASVAEQSVIQASVKAATPVASTAPAPARVVAVNVQPPPDAGLAQAQATKSVETPATAALITPVSKPAVKVNTAEIKPPEGEPVVFPVHVKIRNEGEINPARKAEAVTPQAPPDLPAPVAKALQAAMEDQTSQAPAREPVKIPVKVAVVKPEPKETPASQTAEIAALQGAVKGVPVPRPRPQITTASMDFVRNARRVLEQTYTVMRRDGDQMPAVPSASVRAEKLASAPAATAAGSGPARLSVADIAADPLASKLVAMSPDDIANALNKMAPAAGNSRGATRNGNFVGTTASNYPVIVRENGNWNTRKGAPDTDTQALTGRQTGVATASGEPGATEGKTPVPLRSDYTLVFKNGEEDLPSAAYGEVDSGILSALKASPDARVRIMSYASAKGGDDSSARRVSLSRGLSIRTYLIGKGIDPTRIDVRALDPQQGGKAGPDQVEMQLVQAQKS